MIKELIEDNIINLDSQKVINPFTRQTLKAFSAYKLGDLRDIAESLSIELTKFINDKEKKENKTRII